MAAKLMQAVQYTSYGGGAARLKHVEVPIPALQKDEVLIKIEAASIKPVDWKIQKGLIHPILPRKFPYIPTIMSYRGLPLKKETKKLIHLVLHETVLILGIIGIYTAFKFHNESNVANLYSLHSWIGLGVIIVYALQVVCSLSLGLGGAPSMHLLFWCCLWFRLWT